MNILYLNNEMTVGGVAKCILKLSKELISENNIVIASKETGALLYEFERLGIKNYPLIDVENKMPHNIIANINRLVKIIKLERIDIIHSHHRMTTLIAKFASKITGVKVIHTQHLCIEDKFKLTNIALRNIQIITVSDSAKRILIERANLDDDKIITIYNTIETENKNNEIDSKLLELHKMGYFIVAQVSRAVDYKGVYDFIEIAKESIKESDIIRFIFIGDGPELPNMKKIIDENNLKEYVFLLGNKSNVIEHLKYIDLFILCSYIEGLPLSPIEAFSQGVPVIATDIGGTNEEIINGKNGFLVAMKNIDGFKEKILKISSDESLYKKLSFNSYKIFNDKFTVEKYILNHKRIYEAIIN